MASYAIPPSPLSHNHHGHVHSHSRAHTQAPSLSPPPPRRQAAADRPYGTSSPRSLHQAREVGSLLPRPEVHSHGHDRSKVQSDMRNGNANGGLAVNSYALSPTVSTFGSEASATSPSQHDDHHHSHSHDHHSHDHHHPHNHDHDCSHSTSHVEKKSRFTNFILPRTQNWPLLHVILLEKDSRRIFYFMSLNFAFMLIQAFYGFVTDSLGLLSDSIHMFFDCLALALGLFAAVSSKWPASHKFPYGFSKIESLSGFGNGVFLMLISIEIMIEAAERLAEGRETKRLFELFVVSSLGLAVNLVGMAAFGHHGHHHGHDHSHGGHDHGHDHNHSIKDSHESHSHDSHTSHSHSSDHRTPSPLVSPLPPPTPLTTIAPEKHSHSHGHSHEENENMRGIFLHVLADTMGSAAVIVSTVLIRFFGWPGWDPLASCLIAILIFLSSLPLVKSSAKKLLLTVPDDAEYQLRNTLAGVSGLRGVASYSVPRFWMGDGNPEHKGQESVIGIIHVIATRGSDLNDLKERTRAFLDGHGVDVVVQVEREGEGKCWCGGDNGSRSPLRSGS